MCFVMTVTATIKLTTSIITIFAPKVPIHKEHVFFCKYKEIHRMILYTTYNKYCVSYILLVEWMYVGVVFVSLFFSQFAFSGLWIFFFHVATLIESLPVLTGGGGGLGGLC